MEILKEKTLYDAVCFLSLCVETSPYSTSNSSELDAASKMSLPRPTKVEPGGRRTLVEPKGWRTTARSRDRKAKVEPENWKTLAEATRKDRLKPRSPPEKEEVLVSWVNQAGQRNTAVPQ